MKYNAFEIIKLPYNMLTYFLAFLLSHLTYGKIQTHLILWKMQSRNNVANFYNFIKGKDIVILDNKIPEILCKNIMELIDYNFKHAKQIIKKIILFILKYMFIFVKKHPKLKESLQKVLKKIPKLENKLNNVYYNSFDKKDSKKLKFTDLNLREQEIYQLLAKK